MVDLELYRNYLSNQGGNLAEIRRNRSYDHVNATFRGDPAYKKVYILSQDGWKFEDAKYQRHSTESISKDAVDYYLQFRPGVRYPVGTFVIVPDERSPEINLTKNELANPLLQPPEERTQWWIIVDRTEANMFIRHSILRCDWNFKWIIDGTINECMGCLRSMNSYSSGISETNVGTYIDNLAAAWLSDTYYVYGDKIKDFGLCDTRTIKLIHRFMITHNVLDPKVFRVTKIGDLSPAGIIKYSLDQTEFNSKRDNVDLMLCDYYTESGDVVVENPDDKWTDDVTNSSIAQLEINSDGELVVSNQPAILPLTIGQNSYYGAKFSSPDVMAVWRISIIDENNELSDEKKEYYEGLMRLTPMVGNVIAVKPGKVNSLIGKKFRLEVMDDKNEYYSFVDLEVGEREA